MHGFKNGVSCLSNLCKTSDLVAVEEHWLSSDQLNLLTTVHPDFDGYGVSGMNRLLQTKVYAGRPFGGVCLLWRRELSSRVKVITADVAGRCLAVQFDMCKDKSILIFWSTCPVLPTVVTTGLKWGTVMALLKVF